MRSATVVTRFICGAAFLWTLGWGSPAYAQLGVGEWVIGAVGATLGGIVDAAAGARTSPSAKSKPASGGGLDSAPGVSFTGYDSLDVNTDVIAKRDLADGRVAVMLRETPFYAESGGQVSDTGTITGEIGRAHV